MLVGLLEETSPAVTSPTPQVNRLPSRSWRQGFTNHQILGLS